MYGLTGGFKYSGDGVLCQPRDVHMRSRAAQLLCNRNVPVCVAQTDRRAQVQDPASSLQRASPGDWLHRGRSYLLDELSDQRVDADRVTARRPVAGVLDQGELAAAEFSEPLANLR